MRSGIVAQLGQRHRQLDARVIAHHVANNFVAGMGTSSVLVPRHAALPPASHQQATSADVVHCRCRSRLEKIAARGTIELFGHY
jgi:hypothetical protein